MSAVLASECKTTAAEPPSLPCGGALLSDDGLAVITISSRRDIYQIKNKGRWWRRGWRWSSSFGRWVIVILPPLKLKTRIEVVEIHVIVILWTEYHAEQRVYRSMGGIRDGRALDKLPPTNAISLSSLSITTLRWSGCIWEEGRFDSPIFNPSEEVWISYFYRFYHYRAEYSFVLYLHYEMQTIEWYNATVVPPVARKVMAYRT